MAWFTAASAASSSTETSLALPDRMAAHNGVIRCVGAPCTGVSLAWLTLAPRATSREASLTLSR